MFEKILSIETLKVIDITLNYLNHNDFGKILGLNNSVIKANILWINQKEKNYNILNLLNIFPNLQSINISIINGGSTETTINIKEKNSIKIDKIILYNQRANNIILYYIVILLKI